MKDNSVIASVIAAAGFIVAAIIVAAALSHIGKPIPDAAVASSAVASSVRRDAVAATTNPSTWGDSLLAADELLQPGDIVEVSVNDITGPGVVSTRICRIGRNGKIRLWLIDDLQAAGMGTDKLEPAIADAYAKAQYISHAIVAVTARRAGN